jgi:hypothetical protein
MTDDPKITKVSPHLLEEINRYGRDLAAPPFEGVDGPDLPTELENRGVAVDAKDAELLRVENDWPAEARAALVTLVQAAEAVGVPFHLTYGHDGVPLSVRQVTIELVGP